MNTGIGRIKKVQDALYHSPSNQAFADGMRRMLETIGLNEPYFTAIEKNQDTRKDIKDSIWGMMPFSEDEVTLINSPIIQRLRRIKQLGFSYLTYPSAEHSRFAHTLGVTHVVKTLLRSIEDGSRRNSHINIGSTEVPLFNVGAEDNKKLRQGLIHAAILHDLGHLAFSHAGEQAVRFNSERIRIGGLEIDKFVKIFRKNQILSEFSECLSIAICLSPSFERLYKIAVGRRDDVRNDLALVCCFIAGIPHDPTYPGLASIVSGSVVDADKIDYLTRDARECGVPVGVDTSRIFLHSTLVTIDATVADKLNKSAAGIAHKTHLQPGVHFIVNSAGIDTYDELTKARTVMYNRVYLHHLTRNAEQMLSQCLRLYSKEEIKDVLNFFEHGDVELLNELRTSEAGSIATRIRNRHLMKRALVLSRPLCSMYTQLDFIFDAKVWPNGRGSEGLHSLQAQLLTLSAWKVWGDLVPTDTRTSHSRLPGLVERIRSSAPKVRTAIDTKFDPNTHAEDVLVGFAERLHPKAAKEVLVREKRAIARSVEWTKSEELTQAESISKAMDYIYADHDWLRSVRVATIIALSEHAAELNLTAVDDPVGDSDDYQATRIQVQPALSLALEEISSRIGFDYDELLEDLNATCATDLISDYRLVPLDRSQMEECVSTSTRFERFLGEKGWRVTPASLSAFIRQFPPLLRDEVLELASTFEILDRTELTAALAETLRSLEDHGRRKLAICRFSPNSGNWVGMLLEADTKSRLEARGHRFCRNPNDLDIALAECPDSVIVFVDDQFATGGQAEAQLLHWAGIAREDWPEEMRNEQNIDTSTPSPLFRKHLQEKDAVLAFVYGTEEGRERIRSTAKSVGFDRLDVSYARDLKSNRADMSDELRQALTEIGSSLLARIRGTDKQEDSYPASIQKDALGYGGHASTVVTQNNVPSHVITAFWCPGMHEGRAWLPLLLRRGYRKHLVLS